MREAITGTDQLKQSVEHKRIVFGQTQTYAVPTLPLRDDGEALWRVANSFGMAG